MQKYEIIQTFILNRTFECLYKNYVCDDAKVTSIGHSFPDPQLDGASKMQTVLIAIDPSAYFINKIVQEVMYKL